jgi:hypothetical protein
MEHLMAKVPEFSNHCFQYWLSTNQIHHFFRVSKALNLDTSAFLTKREDLKWIAHLQGDDTTSNVVMAKTREACLNVSRTTGDPCKKETFAALARLSAAATDSLPRDDEVDTLLATSLMQRKYLEATRAGTRAYSPAECVTKVATGNTLETIVTGHAAALSTFLHMIQWIELHGPQIDFREPIAKIIELDKEAWLMCLSCTSDREMIEKIRFTKLHAALVHNKHKSVNAPEIFTNNEFIEDICVNWPGLEQCAHAVGQCVNLTERLVVDTSVYPPQLILDQAPYEPTTTIANEASQPVTSAA